MLLDGQLRMEAHNAEVVDSFRPWFFVVDGTEMYPKYSPVPAAVFALGKLVGGFRVALAAVAFANAFLVYLIVREGFDSLTAVTASSVLAVSPFFLINSSIFLPYATTTAFNLVFAFGYIRTVWGSRHRRAYAALAGVAIGTAFFSRPYTAVVFASPFIVHSLYVLYSELGDGFRDEFVNYSVISFFGVAGVAVTLGYNAIMTGSPLVFPYLEFAPHDGIGFGRRAILGYDRIYTPELGLRANAPCGISQPNGVRQASWVRDLPSSAAC
ncbi:MAG: glycosyltransferase family 39 protein [Halobacteria archaeon]|nr:glycosyltransferase family 39 protein [Halobacteria archaeon]